MGEEILRLDHISKSFSGVQALTDINISFKRGEVHALVGENGAGKSTMMNVIFGNILPSQGVIYLKGSPMTVNDPKVAQAQGIFMIHQEGSLLDSLSVMENVFLSGLCKNRFGFLDNKKIYQKTKEVLELLEIGHIDPRRRVEFLSTSERQLVEIAKAIALNPALVIMDEPTASISIKEVKILMNIIRKLKEQEIGIIYISHKLEEIFEIADVISVLRDGTLVGTYANKDLNTDRLVSLMVGRQLGSEMEELQRNASRSANNNREDILNVEGIEIPEWKTDVSFRLKKGEVLGFAGLVGAGRSELFEALIGYRKSKVQRIVYQGKNIQIRNPAQGIAQGIGMLSEDRREKGIFAEHTIRDNMNIVNLKNLKRGLLLNKKKENAVAGEMKQKLNIKAADLKTRIKNLSGGNQQKVLLARFLSMKKMPQILVLDEPTHGIDVGAKAEIYRIIKKLAEDNISIVLISSEMSELMLLCDRMIVMHEGKITGEINRSEFDQELIMQYASNLKTK